VENAAEDLFQDFGEDIFLATLESIPSYADYMAERAKIIAKSPAKSPSKKFKSSRVQDETPSDPLVRL
jgi:DNA-binding ferritin-like protein